MSIWQQLRDVGRIMWKLGGPFAVFIYYFDGSLERRVVAAKKTLHKSPIEDTLQSRSGSETDAVE